MKFRRNIYIVIGLFLIIVNFLVDIIQLLEKNEYSGESSYNVGYFIGSHFLLLFGLLFLRTAYKVNRKIKSKADLALEKSIHNIGEKETGK